MMVTVGRMYVGRILDLFDSQRSVQRGLFNIFHVLYEHKELIAIYNPFDPYTYPESMISHPKFNENWEKIRLMVIRYEEYQKEIQAISDKVSKGTFPTE